MSEQWASYEAWRADFARRRAAAYAEIDRRHAARMAPVKRAERWMGWATVIGAALVVAQVGLLVAGRRDLAALLYVPMGIDALVPLAVIGWSIKELRG